MWIRESINAPCLGTDASSTNSGWKALSGGLLALNENMKAQTISKSLSRTFETITTEKQANGTRNQAKKAINS